MKRYAKQLAVMALTACISLTGIAANATTSALSFTGDTASFGNTFSAATSSFTDLFTFTTASNSRGGAYAVSSLTSFPYPVTFSSFSLTNYATSLTVPGGSGTIGPSFFAYLGPVSGLNPGTTYALKVMGSSLAGGSYSGSITVTPVPEPQTWAMMLGGLGLIGFMSFRRRNFS